MTLEEAFKDNQESRKFSKIVTENLSNNPEFRDGGVKIYITDFMEGSLTENFLFIDEYKEIDEIQAFLFNFTIKIDYNVLGGRINLEMMGAYPEEITTIFWLMKDNYVCIYWPPNPEWNSKKNYEIVELSEFIKRLKNPIEIIK